MKVRLIAHPSPYVTSNWVSNVSHGIACVIYAQISFERKKNLFVLILIGTQEMLDLIDKQKKRKEIQ